MGPINPTKLSFDLVLEYTDDSAMPLSSLARCEYGFAQKVTGPFIGIVTDTDLTPENGKQVAALDFKQFAIGQWYGAARVVTKEGAVSAWSNAAPFERAAQEPKPPANFSIA